MKIMPPEPLTTEERELAAMLGPLAPRGEPSPDLDARVLAAACSTASAVTRRPRRRWPVPMGLAASLLLAVGVTWQLRPTPPASSFSEMATTAADTVSPGESPGGDPPAESPQAEAPADAEAVASADDGAAPEPAAGRQESQVPAARQRSTLHDVDTSATAAKASPAPAAVQAPAAASAPPPPPPPQVPESSPELRRVMASPVANAQGGPVAASGAERVEAMRAPSLAEDDAGAAAASNAQRESGAARESERDQFESADAAPQASRPRRTELQVPVAADAELQVDDWLERVRTRYGLGDEEAARRSLLLFVRDHPTEPVPGDLEPLLDQ